MTLFRLLLRVLLRLLYVASTLLDFIGTTPVAPSAERTMLGANAWLSYYYQQANHSHHNQDWDALRALHAAGGCGQCEAIPNGSRLSGPGNIRRSPIVGGPAPVQRNDGGRWVFVTAAERVLTGGDIQEQYIDRVTLSWQSGPHAGWRVEDLTFDRIE